MTEVSNTRLYLGNLPRNVTKQDIEEHFGSHGSGKITEIKLMSGFGFIEYEDAMDARDVVPAFHGSDFKGERLTVQFARGPRRKENFPGGPMDRPGMPRPRRTIYRMLVSGLPETTSWQDLKDFARQSGLDVVYSEAGREFGRGFVEFETANDLKTAVEKLDGREFKGARVNCVADVRDPQEPRKPGKEILIPPRFNLTSTVNPTGPAPPAEATHPLMTTTGDFPLHPEATARATTTASAPPSPSAENTTTEMDMAAAPLPAPGLMTSLPRAVPMMSSMMRVRRCRPRHALMIPTWRRLGLSDVRARRPGVHTCRLMTAVLTDKMIKALHGGYPSLCYGV